MTLNINSNINASANIATVFNGNEPRRAPLPQSERTELPQGRGVRASSEVVAQLDDERREQNSTRFASDRRNQQAIDAYQNEANQQRRSEVQALLGVDLYA